MPSTTYVDFSQPAVGATWLNEVNDYIFDGVSSTPSGGKRDAINEVLKRINYNTFVDYAAGLPMSSVDQTVLYNGIPYYPKLADLPFTTSGSFEAAKFAQVYGVSKYELALATGAALVGWKQLGTGAVDRTTDAKLEDILAAKDYGATGDGTTDDTAALLALFDNYALPNDKTVELEGTYLVSGPLCTEQVLASGSLRIHCKGDVRINVSGSAATFNHLLTCTSTAGKSSSITGGSLRIDMNNKGATGIYIRHSATSQTGSVNLAAQITVLNCKQNNAAAVNQNSGVAVVGDYATILFNGTTVDGVTRTNTGGGSCQGIFVSEFSGECTFLAPKVARVLTGNGSSGVDADGISAFGKGNSGTTKTSGKLTVIAAFFDDCQGRSFKSQCSDTSVLFPRVRHKSVVTIASSYDFDFQKGNGTLIEPEYEFLLDSGVSPISATWRCVNFQNLLTDADMLSRSIGGSVKTEIAVNGYAYLTQSSGSLFAKAEVRGLRVVQVGSFATDAFTRAILEFDAATALAKSKETKAIVRDIEGPIGCYGVAYTGYTVGDLSAKLSIEVVDVRNTQAVDAYAVRELSGNSVLSMKSLILRDNVNLRNLMPAGWVLDFATLPAGTTFIVDLATVSATAAPTWPATGYALIESLGMLFATTSREIRVTVENGDQAFFTNTSGTTWRRVRASFTKVVVTNNASGTYTVAAGVGFVAFAGTNATTIAFTLPAAAASLDGFTITIFTEAAVSVSSTWASSGATFLSAPATLAANSVTRFIYNHATTQWFQT